MQSACRDCSFYAPVPMVSANGRCMNRVPTTSHEYSTCSYFVYVYISVRGTYTYAYTQAPAKKPELHNTIHTVAALGVYANMNRITHNYITDCTKLLCIRQQRKWMIGSIAAIASVDGTLREGACRIFWQFSTVRFGQFVADSPPVAQLFPRHIHGRSAALWPFIQPINQCESLARTIAMGFIYGPHENWHPNVCASNSIGFHPVGVCKLIGHRQCYAVESKLLLSSQRMPKACTAVVY